MMICIIYVVALRADGRVLVHDVVLRRGDDEPHWDVGLGEDAASGEERQLNIAV